MHRRLGGAVGREEREVAQPGHRRHVDDGAAAARQPVREADQQAQRRDVVHLHLAARLIDDLLTGQALALDDARVVEQQLDVLGPPRGLAHLVGVRDVEPQRNHAAAVPGRQLLERLRVARRGVDPLRAPLQERLRDGPADAPVGPRHQRHRSLDLPCVHAFLLTCPIRRNQNS